MRRACRLAVALGLGGAVCSIDIVACATAKPEHRVWDDPETTRVWPLPPAHPRIEYVGAIHSVDDLGKKKGLARRFLSAIFGESQEAMIKPISVAKNAAGMLVVVDPGVPTVHFFDLARRDYWRLGEDSASLLRSPVGVAVDDTGRVYVADSERGKVFVFDLKGRLVAETASGLLERPTGLALDPAQQRLYVVDTIACRVVVLGRATEELGRFGRRGTGPGEFNFPTYIAAARDGTISISDSMNFRVQTLRPDGAFLEAFGNPGDGGGDFALPKGLGTDTSGRRYIVDAAFENVQIFDPSGALLLAFGGPGFGPGGFSLPAGMFVDSTDTIWVADSLNRQVQVFRLLRDQR
jgi:DNA-binding beta-propeller fold protein YncE